jgi:hypothetical protein
MTKPSQGDLRGLFLCSKEEVARCLGNRSVHVLIPTVLNLLKTGSVKSIAKRNIGDITNTTGIQSQGNATGAGGAKLGIGTSQAILYVSSA